MPVAKFWWGLHGCFVFLLTAGVFGFLLGCGFELQLLLFYLLFATDFSLIYFGLLGVCVLILLDLDLGGMLGVYLV